MATVELTQRQKELMASLDLPTAPTTDVSDEEWFAMTDRLVEELQHHGINEEGDGTNERGETCRQILNVLALAEDE
ncbi:MAG: hypothetical protein IKG22_04005 [Atopobiaceae bacterium]|nr:hypothetical protein [Atopobiaceae bacterium]